MYKKLTIVKANEPIPKRKGTSLPPLLSSKKKKIVLKMILDPTSDNEEEDTMPLESRRNL